MKKATSQDVARRAGVSQSTVSLVLNGSDKIFFSNETKERVFAAARELDYQLPKRKKRSQAGGTQLLLVLTPTLTNPYYSELVQAVEDYADSCGYRVIVCNTFRKPDLEKYYLDTFTKGKVDGVIYTFLPSFPRIIEQLSVTVPTVIIGEKQDDLNICSIELSNVRSGAMLAEHLYQLGHRHFIFVSTPFNQFTLARQQRLEGMRGQLRGYGLTDECLEVVVPEPSTEADSTTDAVPYEYAVGRQLTRMLVGRGGVATALIGVNDMTAIGMMDELKTQGFSIPGDFSVCGFDNVFSSRLVTPGLTSIDHHLQMRCKAAVDRVLLQRQEGDSATSSPFVNKVEYTPRLIVRGSTGRAPIR